MKHTSVLGRCLRPPDVYCLPPLAGTRLERKLNIAQARAVPRQANYEETSARNLPSRLKVLSLVASCVEINADLARFEELAGRSAMVGFTIAFCAELALPSSGLFGAWGSDSYNAFLGAAILLISAAGALAAMSKRKLGAQLHEAVLTSLTALSRSASSITNRNVDSAVDYVFEQVFGSAFVNQNLLDIDDFI